MKSRNIKTRLAAFGLALLMGLSPLGNLADVHAAETKNPSEPVTESTEISETEQTEKVLEAVKYLVTAEDITKDISDKDFMAETCMEGIHYDQEKEDVTLERIEAEDGGNYHPDQAGTYIATYWVVPKDARDSYSVSRKIILTDTEGQAHAEENGGQKQKEDTNSEEDSETPVQEIPDVEVTVSGEDSDAQAARDLDEKCNRFEKKLHDLELTRTIAMQTAPQIRLIQNNDTVMVEKIQTTIVNTIPLWKSQMVLALGIAHSAEAAQAQRQVTDITNELLRKNAETLHMATVETAKESERGIVDLETLQKTNADLIQTLDDVMRIQMEGRQKRQAAEMEMHRMEEELKRKLLEIR